MCRADSRASSVSPRGRSADPRRDRRARATAISASQVSSLRGSTVRIGRTQKHEQNPLERSPVAGVGGCGASAVRIGQQKPFQNSRSPMASTGRCNRSDAGSCVPRSAPAGRNDSRSGISAPSVCVSRWDRPSKFRRRREEEKRASSASHPPREPSGSIMLPEKMLKSACSHFSMSASGSCALAVRVQAATAVGIEQQEENPFGHFGHPSGSTQEPLSVPSRNISQFSISTSRPAAIRIDAAAGIRAEQHRHHPFQHLSRRSGRRRVPCRHPETGTGIASACLPPNPSRLNSPLISQ